MGRCTVVVIFSKSCPTLCNPTDCSSPGSSVHGISQARILEWVAISFSQLSSKGQLFKLIETESRMVIVGTGGGINGEIEFQFGRPAAHQPECT